MLILLLLLPGLVCLAVALRTRLRPPRQLCPGPCRALPFTILRLLWRRVCRYDLAGLVADDQHRVTCPECGRQVSLPRSLRDGATLRPLAAALLLLTIGAGISLAPRINRGRWLKFVPTTPLLVAERVLASESSVPLRREVTSRIDLGVSADQADLIIPSLIDQLGDDKHDWNAHRAYRLLDSMAQTAVPRLQLALRSSDYQRRQLAARILRNHPMLTATSPRDDLLRITVEGLGDDAIGERSGSMWNNNASSGFQYLIDHAEGADPFLAQGLASTDPQQRFLCAAVAGITGKTSLIAAAAPILVDHLGDNSYDNDAAIAAGALFRFGDAVIPYVEPIINSADRQQADLALLILLDLRGPPKTQSEKDARRRLNRATNAVPDPATELYIGRVGF